MSSPVIPDTTNAKPGLKYRVRNLQAALDQVNELRRLRRNNAERPLFLTGEKSAQDQLSDAREALRRQTSVQHQGISTSY